MDALSADGGVNLMVEPDPPEPWDGYPVGVEEAILGVVHAGERRSAGPLPFAVPPFAPLFPRMPVGNVTQLVTNVVVTDRAFYTVAAAEHPPMVTGQTRTPLTEVTTVSRQVLRRKGRFGGRTRTQWVVMLDVSTRNGTKFSMETRYVGASAVADALDKAVAAVSSASPTGGTPSMADELAKLSDLAATGVLTSDEWERAKSLYLGKAPDRRVEATRLLQQMHDLHRAGALSESEFNTKKWEILSRT